LRFRLLLPALGIPLCVAAAGVGLDAAAFERPSTSVVLATNALHELALYRVMRADEVVGSRRLRSTCVQGWFPRRHKVVRGALVLLSDGTELDDFGHGIRTADGKAATRAHRRAFLLAGCPRLLGDRLGTRLLRGGSADVVPTVADGTAAWAIRVGRASPLELFVDRRTLRPVALTLARAGRSDVEPGGGRSAIAPVWRAFRLSARSERRRA
jgi:hypothetical protein